MVNTTLAQLAIEPQPAPKPEGKVVGKSLITWLNTRYEKWDIESVELAVRTG